MRKKLKNSWMISSAARALGIRATDAERLAGRLLRAPDHDAGTAGDGGAGDGGNGDGGAPAGDGAAGGAPAGGDAGAGGESGASGDASGGAGEGGASGDAGSGEDKTILGGAADDDGGSGGGKSGADGADGGKPEGETRLQFGEGDEAKPILGAPEAYEVTLSEDLTKAGVTFDKEAFDAIAPVLKDLNLSNEAAQALTSAYAEKIMPLLAKRAGDANDAIGADMRRQWAEAAGKEFDGREGRASLNEVTALCKQAFLRSGIKADSPFLKLMEESGLGSHPDMIRTMAYFGRAMGEAAVEAGGGQPAPQRLADRVYGSPTPRE